MPEIPFERITEAIQSLERYHFRIEYTPGIIYEGERDLAEGRQYIQIGLTPGIFPVAEIFWEGEKGYGRRLQSNLWLRMQGKPFLNYLQFALSVLLDANIISIRETESFWFVNIQPEHFPPRDRLEELYRDILGQTIDFEKGEFLERLIEQSQSLEINLQLKISREDYLIYGFTVQCRAQEMQVELTAAFSQSQMDVPPLPDGVQQVVAPDVEVPMEMLLFHLPKIAGWCGKNHRTWTQRAIQLIEEKEITLPVQSRKYTEIYNSAWFTEAYTEKVAKTGKPDYNKHHPIVLGAGFEDCSPDDPLPNFYNNWFASDPNYQTDPKYYYDQKGWRDYHHFGGEGVGLEYALYFEFRGCPSTTKPGDRYYSARDWGYGDGRVNPKHNRLTFTEAIRQYNRYNLDGKRTAYLMLGHVVHLLQDVGQPDHAKLVAHPGSSFTELEAYKKYKYCEIVAGLAAAACLKVAGLCFFGLCCAGVFGAVFGICRDCLSDEKVGYERLIKDKWSLDHKIPKNEITATGIVTQPSYDAYFSDLSKFCISKANITSPLGCGKVTFPLVPSFIGVPGGRPFIHVANKEQVDRFLEMTNKIVPRIIGASAGMIQYFYDIVNYPPYVERVAIVQWEPRAVPRKFAFFSKNQLHCVRYDAEWVMSKNKRILNYRTKTRPLSLDRPAYIFILFGPTEIDPEKGGKIMEQPELRLVGTYPLTGKPIDMKIKLKLAQDNDVGQYYWGSFNPHNCSDDPYTLTLIIQGKDGAAHLAQRKPSGDEIDAKPATIARVDASLPPTYPWKDYEPGPDVNHKIQIPPAEWKLMVNPSGLLAISPQREGKGEVTLQIKQKAWDCQWEPYWGPVTCPVRWELSQNVTKLGKQLQTGSWEDFNFQVQLIVHRSGDAKLVITPDWQMYTPGRYELKVLYEVGEPPKVLSNIVTILVELL